MPHEAFQFKHFICAHSMSAHKIGVDAVFIGAWVNLSDCKTMLDVGTGCGVISLMCAQRSNLLKIDAIDIDADSIRECNNNFSQSPWKNRLNAQLSDFRLYESPYPYDLIISNPPYFKSGIENPDSARLLARHEGSLSPASIIARGADMISSSGRIALILPSDRLNGLIQEAEFVGMVAIRGEYIRAHANAKAKRVMVEFAKTGTRVSPTNFSILTLTDSNGEITEQYRNLCHDFYLKF